SGTLAHRVLLDLPCVRLGQPGKAPPFGKLEAGQVPTAERDDLLLRGFGVRLQFDEGAWCLPPFLIRTSDDRLQGNGRVPVQDGFDLHRRDVLAAGYDDVL